MLSCLGDQCGVSEEEEEEESEGDIFLFNFFFFKVVNCLIALIISWEFF